mgnify:CR=1 FL=1
MKTNLKEKVGRLARYVIRLEEVHQRHFIATLFECFSEKERLKRFEWVSRLVYPESKWLKIYNWMEKIFTQDMKKTPMGVASMCRHYFRINPKMMPFLIKTAQKIKELKLGEVLEVVADDKGIKLDMPAWCEATGHEFLGVEEVGGEIKVYVKKAHE